jgi:histidinol-phosphate aminotransferase
MPQPKPFISRIRPPVHGSTGFADIEDKRKSRILDFSTCCNPYKPPQMIRSAMAKCDLQQYPDPESGLFINGISRKLGVNAENIIAGSGSTELLRLAAAAYFGPGDTVVIPSPTYGEYELACQSVDASITRYALQEKQDYRLNAADFIDFARPLSPKGLFICNPNNPTGHYLSRHEIESIVSAFPGALIILDEAYIAFTANSWNSLDLVDSGNLFIVRSMTKDFALAGLRLGYGLASRSIIDTLKKVRPPWNVSSPAQDAGTAALSCDDYLEKSCRRIESSKLYLIRSLSGTGYKIMGTQTNFFLVRTACAAAFRQKLLKKDILVRDCTSFGLPDYIRIAPRNASDCRRLVQAMKEIAGNKE